MGRKSTTVFFDRKFLRKMAWPQQGKGGGNRIPATRGIWIAGIFQLKPYASVRFGGFSPKENMLRLRVILVGSLSAQEISDAAKVEFFSQKIFPILKENWFKCHGVKAKLKGASHHQSRVVAQGR
jgi:hypothetical protein